MKNPNDTLSATPVIDPARRRLTKAGLAAPAVLGVLASRPVLGNSLYNCTPSGHISGFASPNPNGTNCALLGKGPIYYRDPATWPSGFKDSNGNPLPFNEAPINLSSPFFSDAYVILNNGGQIDRRATVLEVLMGQYIGTTQVQSSPQGKALSILSNNTATGPQQRTLAVNAGYSDSTFILGQEAIAACMNAALLGAQGFPISPMQAVNMFNHVIVTGGVDPVTSSATWNALEVVEYFQSLHS